MYIYVYEYFVYFDYTSLYYLYTVFSFGNFWWFNLKSNKEIVVTKVVISRASLGVYRVRLIICL